MQDLVGLLTDTLSPAYFSLAVDDVYAWYLEEIVGRPELVTAFGDLDNVAIARLRSAFDAEWYRSWYPDLGIRGSDPFIHYMVYGWRELRDPSRKFSTLSNLIRHPHFWDLGVNPFTRWALQEQPSIAAVLINTDLEPLSVESLDAVLQQAYPDLTVLIVGAPLPDTWKARLDDLTQADAAKVISYQLHDATLSKWELLRHAAEHAPADLLWFVEGRGTYDEEYLTRLASSFADGSVQLGVGRLQTQENDPATEATPSLAPIHIWRRPETIPAATWLVENLRPDRLAANYHDFLWRRRTLSESVWAGAGEFSYLGFWHLYLHMASGGQIASVPEAIVHVRSGAEPLPHDSADPVFHTDMRLLAAEIGSSWGLKRAELSALLSTVPAARVTYEDPLTESQETALDSSFSAKYPRKNLHVLLVVNGIFAGGAENFPLKLANELMNLGITVSLLVFRVDNLVTEMRRTLNPGVSIYEADYVYNYGCEKFIVDIGCSVIHSHGVVGETFFFARCDYNSPVPYIATLHGSYESSTSQELPESVIAKIVAQVDLFVYTAEKNLGPLLRNGLQPGRFIKMKNAMPIDHIDFPKTRADLNIAADAIVFTLVARGIPEKGWSVAINAFEAVRKANPNRSMHLCLVGDGDEPERLKSLQDFGPFVTFLGFQLRIHGLYRMTDVAIVPTRFAGESYPLCIIQALQSAVPVVATDVGEISSMLQSDGLVGGILVTSSTSDEVFETRFAAAMQELLDDERRLQIGRDAAILGSAYDMAALTREYARLYENVVSSFSATRSARPGDEVERDYNPPWTASLADPSLSI